MRCGLTGNLCRCTGYTPIIEAGCEARCRRGTSGSDSAVSERRDACANLPQRRGQPIEVRAEWDDAAARVRVAAGSGRCAGSFWLRIPMPTIVAGATDIGVRINKSLTVPRTILDLNRVAELDGVAVENGELVLGSRASWTAIEEACAKSWCPSSTRSSPCSGRRRFGTSARSAATSPTPRRSPIRCRFCMSWTRCWSCAVPTAHGV